MAELEELYLSAQLDQLCTAVKKRDPRVVDDVIITIACAGFLQAAFSVEDELTRSGIREWLQGGPAPDPIR